jgi:hypothetical protein
MATEPAVTPTVDDPLAATGQSIPPTQLVTAPGPYDVALAEGEELRSRPHAAAGVVQVMRQHA